MSKFFLTCLLFLFLLTQEVKSSLNAPKAFESGLIATDYVDSQVLFITSSDGKIYAYDMEKHSLKWMIETDISLQQLTYNSQFKLDELDFMLMPDFNGKMQVFSPTEGFQEFGKADVEQALHTCFSPGKIKYFSKVQETFLMIDLNKGMFWKLDDAYENIDPSRLDSYGVLKIKQYRYNAIDFQTMKELWSLKTSDLDFYTYFQFLNHGNIPNPSKLLQNYKIICKGGNTIELLRARDETFLRSIETENEVISVHSLDHNSGFFSLKIESVGSMASSSDESEVTQLMVYNQKIRRESCSGDSESHELAIFDGRNRQESGISYSSGSNFSTSRDIQIKNNPIYSDSIFSCIKEEIQKKHAIQLLNTTNLLENGTLVIYDYDNEEKPVHHANPYVLAGTLGCMVLTAILSLVIERRRNKKLKKSVSMSTETEPEPKTSGVSIDESTGGGSSSSRTKQIKAGEVPKERKKKIKKRDFEVFTKEVLGLGSHGTMVFQGEFQGKSVAVKRFLKCYLEMARMEIDLLMATEHPNIIRYYLYEEDNEFIYLILERCLCSMRNFIDHFNKGKENEADGGNSKDVVNYKQAIRRAYREKTITSDVVRKFALDIAKGLQYLHRLGIIHRDIKPENILLSLNLDAKLADFGISKILKPEEEHFLTEAGSMGWKAPEMLKKTDLKSKPVDIFSLGCTFYYLHTKGEHPFGERHERDGNILMNRPQMKYLEDMALEHLIKCMIKYNPEERYTIDDVLNHPYFWEEGKKLAFIQEISDFVESTDPRLGRMLEDYCQKKSAIPIPWNKALDQSLVRDLTSFRFYDFKSVKELLRVIRNKKNHYYELSEEAKEALGKMPVGVWNYFNDRFPRLFMNVYIFCIEQKVELSCLA